MSLIPPTGSPPSTHSTKENLPSSKVAEQLPSQGGLLSTLKSAFQWITTGAFKETSFKQWQKKEQIVADLVQKVENYEGKLTKQEKQNLKEGLKTCSYSNLLILNNFIHGDMVKILTYLSLTPTQFSIRLNQLYEKKLGLISLVFLVEKSQPSPKMIGEMISQLMIVPHDRPDLQDQFLTNWSRRLSADPLPATKPPAQETLPSPAVKEPEEPKSPPQEVKSPPAPSPATQTTKKPEKKKTASPQAIRTTPMTPSKQMPIATVFRYLLEGKLYDVNKKPSLLPETPALFSNLGTITPHNLKAAKAQLLQENPSSKLRVPILVAEFTQPSSQVKEGAVTPFEIEEKAIYSQSGLWTLTAEPIEEGGEKKLAVTFQANYKGKQLSHTESIPVTKGTKKEMIEEISANGDLEEAMLMAVASFTTQANK